MNKEQAQHFIKQLFTEVWTEFREDKLSVFYHHNVIAHIGKQTADYQAIMHRLHFVKKYCQTIMNDIEDILLDDDKITVRLTQTYVLCKDSQQKIYTTILIYKLVQDKIAEIWACIDPQINYFENSIA